MRVLPGKALFISLVMMLGQVEGEWGGEGTGLKISRKDLFFEFNRIFLGFLAIFRNEITTILTPSTSEGGEWGR